jgi:hypothetical protein
MPVSEECGTNAKKQTEMQEGNFASNNVKASST